MQRAKDQRALGHCRRRQGDLAQMIRRQQLILWPGLDDEHVTIFVGKLHPSVGGHRRSREISALSHALLIDALAGERP